MYQINKDLNIHQLACLEFYVWHFGHLVYNYIFTNSLSLHGTKYAMSVVCTGTAATFYAFSAVK